MLCNNHEQRKSLKLNKLFRNLSAVEQISMSYKMSCHIVQMLESRIIVGHKHFIIFHLCREFLSKYYCSKIAVKFLFNKHLPRILLHLTINKMLYFLYIPEHRPNAFYSKIYSNSLRLW